MNPAKLKKIQREFKKFLANPIFKPASPVLKARVTRERRKFLRDFKATNPPMKEVTRVILMLTMGIPQWDVSATEHLELTLKLIDRLRQEYKLPPRKGVAV